ncbi:hypothetical protein RJ639_047202 [Escallonia herrerae]|uniref:GAG-pre-integrase domain-containing protein n=1 Tax=Escallonia herrerae TaxID=1293975 RepID=A0AA88W7A0_9ASTE|nr:hypothetical protein RJ639_047202 [Escallonia herrerae]
MVPNTSMKYDLEKFDGLNDFSLWRMKMHVVLIQQGLLKALKWNQGLLEMMSADEKKDMLERAYSVMLLHVPKLRKNLIFFGTLDSNGCNYWAVDETMRIMKGSLVVKKGLKQNSLYLLQGSTVTRAAVSSSDIDSDTTKLWHMRLGHMSERSMDVLALSKQGLHRLQLIVRILKKFGPSSMLSKKEELIDTEKDHGVREKVELKVRALYSFSIIPTNEEDGSHSTEENEEPQE